MEKYGTPQTCKTSEEAVKTASVKEACYSYAYPKEIGPICTHCGKPNGWHEETKKD